MGGGKKRSFFSMFFRFARRARTRDIVEEPKRGGRIWASDEDRGRWVGEPDIDRKATEFITKFHETRCTEIQTVQA
ncbi:hypothetical protein ZOSMA_37G00490 [Zostera marina]|uniref:Uncharacterized protein n=1 Tax=Zostera marina TaxID=29655 RepID=A0A0K9P5A3_ZOSMR|nr:hypothetical protein ZOSMA_37G00490 [Zostera marina]